MKDLVFCFTQFFLFEFCNLIFNFSALFLRIVVDRFIEFAEFLLIGCHMESLRSDGLNFDADCFPHIPRNGILGASVSVAVGNFHDQGTLAV